MTLDSFVTFFALAISPIVAVVFALLFWFKRDPVSRPSIVAAIPLGLTSIPILLGQSAVLVLSAFQELATRKTAGMGAVTAGLLRAQRPLIWGFADFAACLIVLFLISTFLRYSRDEDTPPIHAYISLPALIATAAFLISLFLLVYLQYGTFDLIMMIVDKHRFQEIASRPEAKNIAQAAAGISNRLIAIVVLSALQYCALVVAAALDLFWRQQRNSRQPLATLLTVGALLGCGLCALNELGFADYLTHLH